MNKKAKDFPHLEIKRFDKIIISYFRCVSTSFIPIFNCFLFFWKRKRIKTNQSLSICIYQSDTLDILSGTFELIWKKKKIIRIWPENLWTIEEEESTTSSSYWIPSTFQFSISVPFSLFLLCPYLILFVSSFHFVIRCTFDAHK